MGIAQSVDKFEWDWTYDAGVVVRAMPDLAARTA
jgi:hypothetical protein